eukprot:TRINITY_DN3541_c0_g1_i1.p1 TRINITY_DN3541_c0_g1~~TRINITY_DN3541_c0_g1_i1.p1  ORF type:complete len:397 (-),score=68.14 TRINITY_DN3541_c0_g1_i1:143-1333(-)
MSDKKNVEIVPGNFWSTQPVPQNAGQTKQIEPPGQPIDPIKEPKDVRQDPYTLPEAFEWYACDINDEKDLMEVYRLLRDHYVEDDDNMFRFDYSPEFLKWALKPPGWKREWHLCVRSKLKGAIVGFITAIPADIVVYDKHHRMVEINFLCVHQKLRTKRLAPVLIKEITRRANINGIFQAVYTAGVTLPMPIASCQYWHRSLNPRKLIEVGFSQLKQRMTHTRTEKLFALPPATKTPGLRPLEKKDCASACALLNEYLKKFHIFMYFTLEDFEHWFLPVKGVVDSFVVCEGKTVTDLISFYSLPSSILKSEKHKTLYAAYSWYNVATSVPLTSLMNDSLILAKKQGFDVFNCLAIHDNQTFLKDLKFGAGDGNLQFYLYNWLAPPMQPGNVGLVLL